MESQHADPNDVVGWRKEISDRQFETEKVVNGLAVSVSRMEQSITDLAGAVRGLVQDQRSNKRDFPFATVISFAMLLLVAAGGYATLMMVPIRDQQASNTGAIAALQASDIATAKWQGIVEGREDERSKRLESLEAALKVAEQQQISSAYAFGRQEAFEGRLDKLSERMNALGQRAYDAKP